MFLEIDVLQNFCKKMKSESKIAILNSSKISVVQHFFRGNQRCCRENQGGDSAVQR